MTAKEIRLFFENLIDDTIDTDFAYDLMNNAKDEVESERDWEVLKKIDISIATSSGDNYDTSYSLPSDFYAPLLEGGVFVGSREYYGYPFEKKLTFKGGGYRYFIDHKNKKIYFSGSRSQSETVTLNYVYATDDFTQAAEDTGSPVWPGKFHKLLAFKMAELYQAGLDADDISFRMSGQQRVQMKTLMNNMIQWDARLKMVAMHGRTSLPETDYKQHPDMVNLDA